MSGEHIDRGDIYVWLSQAELCAIVVMAEDAIGSYNDRLEGEDAVVMEPLIEAARALRSRIGGECADRNIDPFAVNLGGVTL